MRNRSRRITAVDIAKRKNGERIVALTAYHAHTAGIVDRYCDFILVGDSLGMVMHGLETTVPVTLDMMILQGRAVMRGSKRALVVVDMPFGSYEENREQAFRNAARVLKETGAGAIKLEGGAHMAETVAFLVRRGVPVMGHVGLTPQAVNTMGGFRVQGHGEEGQKLLEADARAIADAGAFAIVMEGIVEPVARAVTAVDRGADDRHRRVAGLRRPDPGAGGHAGPQRLDAEIREEIRLAPRPDRGGGVGLCQGGARRDVSRAGARLRAQKALKRRGFVASP